MFTDWNSHHNHYYIRLNQGGDADWNSVLRHSLVHIIRDLIKCNSWKRIIREDGIEFNNQPVGNDTTTWPWWVGCFGWVWWPMVTSKWRIDLSFVMFGLLQYSGPLQNEAERSSCSQSQASKTQQSHPQYALNGQKLVPLLLNNNITLNKQCKGNFH